MAEDGKGKAKSGFNWFVHHSWLNTMGRATLRRVYASRVKDDPQGLMYLTVAMREQPEDAVTRAFLIELTLAEAEALADQIKQCLAGGTGLTPVNDLMDRETWRALAERRARLTGSQQAVASEQH